MKASTQLTSGTIYQVLIRGQKRRTRRVFKWNEKRFRKIPCLVFTSPVPRGMQAAWNPETKTLSLRGARRFPDAEVSVPHYDLLEAVAV